MEIPERPPSKPIKMRRNPGSVRSSTESWPPLGRPDPAIRRLVRNRSIIFDEVGCAEIQQVDPDSGEIVWRKFHHISGWTD
jgi:hypothetical protein